MKVFLRENPSSDSSVSAMTGMLGWWMREVRATEPLTMVLRWRVAAAPEGIVFEWFGWESSLSSEEPASGITPSGVVIKVTSEETPM
eukprot:CAMPEP_0185588534 /NCGR_PEP_ID=MMETSP0434-20130131/53503_1 /TAXON_ID=626734 ORGANISM="Favella taraikaensis, Strain Fe Narragansett Bay" /NCGR_SAMPLE_ID=MMETSP0434 /ASSEMBLY_ACC=CAM_ASM_000379 /LENGTH=86 /DNA_ID=CAMNT_0028211281 /DNA_START=117 /DNA_END=377 /DNA_ORIENTATION=-